MNRVLRAIAYTGEGSKGGGSLTAGKTFHWERAWKKFKLAGDERYDNDEAEDWVQLEMLTEAFSHWDEDGRVRRGRAPRRYRWWNAMAVSGPGHGTQALSGEDGAHSR